MNRSGPLTFLIALIALLNLIGLYLLIDSNSRFTQATAENTRQLSALADRIERLSSIPQAQATKNVTKSSTAHATTAAAAEPTAPAVQKYANAEFRQPQAVPGGRRITTVNSFSGNLNSLMRTENTTSIIWDICNDELGDRNLMHPYEFEPKLAESWTVSSDGMIYDIKIHKGVTWHPYKDPISGVQVPAKEVTADDFVFFWEMIQNQDIPCEAHRVYYQAVQKIEATGSHSLRITWKEPYSKAEEISLTLSPYPRHYYRPDPKWTDKEFADQMKTSQRNQYMVGCGPYRIAEYKSGEFLRLERYEGYYGPKPYAQNLLIKVVPEQSIALVQLKKGEIDDINLLPEQWVKETPAPLFQTVTPTIATAIADSAAWDVKKLAGQTPAAGKLEKYQYNRAATSWSYVGYNLTKPVFRDKLTRQALSCLTDRQRILKDVFFGLGEIVEGPFTPNSPYADPSVKPFAYDPVRAAELLKQAGWKDSDGDGILDRQMDGKLVKFSFPLIIPSVSVNGRKIISIMQADFKRAGIDLQIQPLEWSVFIDRLDQKSFDACTLGWTGVLEPDPYQVWHGSQADKPQSSNAIGFKNARADALIDAGRRTLDKEKRKEIYREFFRIVHDEQPYTFLIAPTTLAAQSARYHNARVYPLGMSERLQWVPRELQIQ